MNPRHTFRLTLWIFMTVVAGYLLAYTVAHHGNKGKITAQGVLFALGIVMCLVIFRAARRDRE